MRAVVACSGALNFKDVMLAYGKLATDLMDYGQGVPSHIGLEFSGQVRGHCTPPKPVPQNAAHACCVSLLRLGPANRMQSPAGRSVSQAAAGRM